MPDWTFRRKPEGATADELRSLLSLRLECLEAATRQQNGDAPLPIAERFGWQARIKTLGRGLEGHLLATVTVSQPGGKTVYVRRVRLVHSQPLPRDLRYG
jgi:hypothetical protein